MGERTFGPKYGQVRTSGNLLGMSSFLDIQGRNPNIVIVLKRQLDGLFKNEIFASVAEFGGVAAQQDDMIVTVLKVAPAPLR